MLTQLKSELSPTEDRGTIIVSGNAPEGASFAYTQRYAEQVEEILQGIPDIRSALLIVGIGDVTQMNSFARLKDWSERNVSQQEIVQKLLPKLRAIAGIQASASNPASLGVRGFGKPMQFVIQSSASYAELNEIANKLVEKLKDNPGLADLDTDMRLNKPEVQIEIDRARAADLGLDVTVIGRTLETLLGGRNVSTFEIGSEQYDVTVALPAADRTSTETLSRIFVRGSGWRDGAAFQCGDGARGRGAARSAPLQPAARHHHPGQSGARLSRWARRSPPSMRRRRKCCRTMW